nr:MAG TPA: nucleoid-associated protein [Caudoviricetes sp.]
MPVINISVENKIAEADGTLYVCDNSDFVAKFAFDAEWEAYENKTARFCYNNSYVDVVFTGNECPVPIISGTYFFNIGVYAGNLRTTTPARVPCKKSILCDTGFPADPPNDVYNQIMEKLNSFESADPKAIAKVVANYLAEHPVEETDPTVPEWAKAETKPTYTADEVGAISQDDLKTATNNALAQAKASGAFRGDKGDPGAPGAKGEPGEPGKDGVSPTVSTAATTGGTKVTITDAKGSHEFVVKDGANGADGSNGKDGTNGKDGADGKPGTAGADGVTPHIGDNGNWYLGGTDTGKPSRGAPGASGHTPVKGTDYWTAADKQEIIDDIHLVFYIDLAGKYPNYTCQVAMDDIKAAYNSGYNLVCRCALGAYTATLPLFVPMPAANTWIFSGSGALAAMGFPAQSLTIAIVNGTVQASDTRLASMDDIPTIPTALKNPNELTIKIGSTTVTYDGSVAKTVEIADGSEVRY